MIHVYRPPTPRPRPRGPVAPYQFDADGPINVAPTVATLTWEALSPGVSLGGVAAGPAVAESAWATLSPGVALGNLDNVPTLI